MKWKKGYTIIEILVALSITGIIFGSGFVSFRDFSRRQLLNGTVRSLKTDLRLAQEYALIGKKPDDAKCNEPNFLYGYRFFVRTSSQYIIRAYCSPVPGQVNVKIVDLPSDISISAPSTNPITFNALGEGTDLTGDVTITVTQLSTGKALPIIVSMGGEIK